MIFLGAYLAYAFLLSLALGSAGFRAGNVLSTARGGRLQPTRILIVGATGGTGRALVAQALDHGYHVTALARDPARLGIEHPRLRVLRGDVLDAATLDAAVAGQEAVLSALGHRQFFRPSRIQSEGARNLLQAMERHGVRRFIGASALGLGDSAFRFGLLHTLFIIPVILPFYFWDKARQERVIADSAADWTIVRPGALTNGPRTGQIRHGPAIGGVVRTARVSRADVAGFMLEQLADDQYLRAAPGLSL